MMISVIIPSYNREHSIVAAVRSVLNQTYADLEVIVVDDGSTDATCRLIEEINDGRVRLVHQSHEGACAARNKGIDEARGEYIAFHDSDDLCREMRLEHQLSTLIEKQADLVCGNVLTHLNGREFITPKYKSGWLTDKDMLFNITTMTFLGKADFFKRFRFDPSMPRWQDLDILLSAVNEAKIYFTDRVLCDYFREGDSMSLNPAKCVAAFDKMMDKYPFIKEDGGILYSRLLKMYADSQIQMKKSVPVAVYKNIFKNNKSIVNLIWLFFASINSAEALYQYLHR